jgi:hypothetical protein
MIGNAAQRFDTAGKLADETTKDYMRQLLENLVELIRRVGQPSPSASISDRPLLAPGTHEKTTPVSANRMELQGGRP